MEFVNDQILHGNLCVTAVSPVKVVVCDTCLLYTSMKGTIGIIGPKRMDYEHVMKTLKTLQSELDAIYYKDPEE